MKTRPTWITTLLMLACASCSTADAAKDSFDFEGLLGGSDGKADMLSSAHIVREADLDATFSGDFDPRVRVVGFSVQAKVGAVLDIDMTTAAGADSIDVGEGEALDTVMAVYGPMEGEKLGPLVVRVDDDDQGTAAQLPPIEIEQEGEYLVLLSSWNDPGHGRYLMDLSCEGTDFQCRRPAQDSPCAPGTEYIMGGQSVGTTTWGRCHYVLLEQTHVEPEAILTVEPGVTVQGNFLGEGDYGTVRMVVDGVLQATGTEEHPVVFTSFAADKGWAGLVLGGRSTLSHVYVENAQTGIEVVGDGNLLEDIDINSSHTGVVFRGQTTGHRIRRGHIAKVTDGIVMEQTVVQIDDTVILGQGDGTGIGVRGIDTTASFFERALVSGFGTGIDLTSAELEMVDATISNNDRGVRVTGEDAGIEPAFTCPDLPSFAPTRPARTWPPAPTSWRRDPIFRRVDLVHNAEYAVRIDAPELLVIEQSNIRGNGAGILIESASLHADSRITGNNIHDNGDGLMQLLAYHNDGTLDISGNYWAQISDPELSASWDNEHDDYALDGSVCDFSRGTTSTPSCSCGDNCNTRVCPDYTCVRSGSRWNCSLSGPLLADPWTSEVVFTGFSPEPLPAGPDLEQLSPAVQQERGAQEL